jgi:hypothetical protein
MRKKFLIKLLRAELGLLLGFGMNKDQSLGREDRNSTQNIPLSTIYAII